MRLKDYFSHNGIKVSAFAEIHDIPVQTLYRLMTGTSMNLHTAAKLVMATAGDVGFHDLLTPKEREDLTRREAKRHQWLNKQLSPEGESF